MTTANGQRHAAIYARVSTTDQADKGYSLPTQTEACLALAHREGYTVPEEYFFREDYTGTSLNRPQLIQLRDLMRQGLIQAVVVYDQDRLSRKLAHLLLLTDECEQYNVRLCVVTMPASDKTPESQLMANVRGIIVEYDRLKILERTTRGLAGRAKAGNPAPNTVPLGYRYLQHGAEKCPACDKQHKGGCYVLEEEEAAVVRRIFTLYIEGGHSMLAIAKQLTRERILTQRDRREKGPVRRLPAGVWHVAMIQRILTNETYIGRMYYGKRENRPSRTNPDKRAAWGRRPREAWIAIAVPPIIDEHTCAAAQVKARDNAQNSRRNRRHEYLFANARLRCGRCGRGMRWTLNNSRGYSYYRCNIHRYISETSCRGGVNAKRIEAEVWAEVEKALRDPERIAGGIECLKHESLAQHSDLDREQRSYETQLAQCERELKKWETAYLNDAVDLVDFKAKKDEIAVRRTSAEQELARLAEQQRVLAQVQIDIASLTAYCERVRNTLRQPFDLAEKRKVVEALHITITWYPDKPFEIQGRIPLEIAS